MSRSSLRTLCALALAISLVACGSIGRTDDGLMYVDITAERLQRDLEAGFPLRECAFQAACATFSKPRLQLAEGANRLRFGSAVQVEFGVVKVPGQIEISATPRYDASRKAMFLSLLRVERLSVDGVPVQLSRTIAEQAGPLLQPMFDRHPVYRVEGDGLQDALVRRSLRGVSVVDGKLRATFAFAGATP